MLPYTLIIIVVVSVWFFSVKNAGATARYEKNLINAHLFQFGFLVKEVYPTSKTIAFTDVAEDPNSFYTKKITYKALTYYNNEHQLRHCLVAIVKYGSDVHVFTDMHERENEEAGLLEEQGEALQALLQKHDCSLISATDTFDNFTYANGYTESEGVTISELESIAFQSLEFKTADGRSHYCLAAFAKPIPNEDDENPAAVIYLNMDLATREMLHT